VRLAGRPKGSSRCCLEQALYCCIAAFHLQDEDIASVKAPRAIWAILLRLRTFMSTPNRRGVSRDRNTRPQRQVQPQPMRTSKQGSVRHLDRQPDCAERFTRFPCLPQTRWGESPSVPAMRAPLRHRSVESVGRRPKLHTSLLDVKLQFKPR
jgi:hypothetical protein